MMMMYGGDSSIYSPGDIENSILHAPSYFLSLFYLWDKYCFVNMNFMNSFNEVVKNQYGLILYTFFFHMDFFGLFVEIIDSCTRAF